MLCLVCDADVVLSDINNVEIGYCPNCRDLALNHDEISKVFDRNKSRLSKKRKNLRKKVTDNNYRKSQQGFRYKKERKRKSALNELFEIFD